MCGCLRCLERASTSSRGAPQTSVLTPWLPSWSALPESPAPCLASSRPMPDSLTCRLSAFTRRGGVGTVPVPSTELMCGGSSGEGWTRCKRRQRVLEQGSAVREAVEDFTCRVGGVELGSRHHVRSASCFLLVLPVLPPHVVVAARVSASCSCSSTWQHAHVVCAALSCDRK